MDKTLVPEVLVVVTLLCWYLWVSSFILRICIYAITVSPVQLLPG